MIEVLMQFLSHKDDTDEKIKVLKKINDINNSFISKLMSFFMFVFMLALFMFSLMSSLALVFFSFVGDELEEYKVFFIVGSFGTAIFAFTFFMLMRKTWRKLKKTIERELDLEL